jgi:energy-coupling factor transporter ATP-binding protein EcfA2
MAEIPKNLLEQPSLFSGNSPVSSLKQELPFSELTWENFERLCLRLAKENSNIENCRLYGGPGDNQEGIDIYAKKSGADKYITYQCKREEGFGPQKIKDAVSTFLAGEWAKKTEEFVLCTQESLRKKSRHDEVVTQLEILQRENIILKIWDSDELSIELKKFPQIVYDFFGIVWCETFCGTEATKAVTKRKAPPPKKVYPPVENYLERLIVEMNADYSTNIFSQGKALSSFIKTEKRIALLGPANNGKSTELAHLASMVASETNLYPYLVRLKNHTGEVIKDYIPEIEDIPQNQILVLLDGLDEVPIGGFDSARRKIQKFADDFSEVRIVISCRNNFYVTYSEDNTLNTLQGFTAYTLKGLSQKQIESYLDQLSSIKNFNKANFLSEIDKKRFNNLLYTPYYLIRLVKQFIEEGALAENIIEITDKLIQESIRKDVARYFPVSRSGKEQFIYQVLIKIAFILEYTGKNNCTWSELQLMILPAEEELIRTASSLLEGSESATATWSFTHNNFQEVLAAKCLQNTDANGIRKVICFPSSYEKVKPTWANTLSLLLAILDEKKRKALIDWLCKDQLDLIIRSEPNVIDEKTRFEVFKRIFEHYTQKGTRINDSKYNIDTLSSFAKSDMMATYLLGKLEVELVNIGRINALEILSYCNIELEFPRHATQLKAAIENNIYGTGNTAYHAIRAYANGFQLTHTEFDRLFLEHVKSPDTWVLSALYSAILRQGKQESRLKEILTIIKDFIKSEHSKREGRLADEYMLLRECVSTITSLESVKELLDFLKVNYDSVFYSTYFREIIDFVLKIAVRFKTDRSIYEKIKDIFISEDIHLVDNRNVMFLDYFKNTDQLTILFKDIYASQNPLSRLGLRQLSQLASPASIGFIVEEFRSGKISEENAVLFQSFLSHRNPSLLIDFNEKINTIQNIPLPVFKDYQTEKKKQNDATREILFDKDKFVDAVSKIFHEAAKDELTYDEMWNYTHGIGHELNPPILHEVIRFRDKNHVLKKDILIDKLKRIWDRFSIEQIYRFLKNDKTIEVSDRQKQIIRQWCDNRLGNFSFTTATTKTKNGYSVKEDAIHLSFFIRRFGFKHYPESVYLDMLSFQKWDDDDADIFEFVSSVVAADQIDARVLSNLQSVELYPAAFENHLEYCKNRQLKSAASLLIPFIQNPDTYRRHETLQCFKELEGDLLALEGTLAGVHDNFKFEIIKLLIHEGSQTISGYVQQQFKTSTDPELKLRYAFYLIQLDKMKGMRYFLSYIKTQREIPMSPDAPFSNFLGPLKELKFLPAVFKLYQLGYQPDIKQAEFASLHHTAATALNSICLHNDNFPWARRIFRVFRFLKKIRYRITKDETIKKLINDFDFYFENIEQQYYINKGTVITTKDAIGVYEKVK